ncbi:MAG: peptidylprolyl isomerase, partial [Dokdonella sp.]
YQANRESFNIPATLDVQHILISNNKHTDEEGRALADKVHVEAVANPTEFDSLVSQYSEDPSAPQNRGLMREAGDSSKYVTEFAKAANELKTPEQISPVVKTKFGYHVLMLIKKAPPAKRTFADVKDSLLEELRADYVNQKVLSYMQTMQNSALESNAELVNSLRTRFGSVATMNDADQPSPAATDAQTAPTTK